LTNFYISDLDGTLLDEEGGLTPDSQKYLEDLLLKGYPISFATGRNLPSAKKALGFTPSFNIPVISSDGAVISDFAGKPLYIFTLKQTRLLQLLNTIIENGFNPFLEVWTGSEYVTKHNPLIKETDRILHKFKIKLEDMVLEEVLNLKEHLEGINITFTCLGSKNDIDALCIKLRSEFSDEYKIDNMHMLVVNHLEEMNNMSILWIEDVMASKDNAIKKWAELMQVPLKNITIFGDQYNDLPMFCLEEPYKVAVANAIEPLKEKANTIIGFHTEQSVLKYIEKDFKF
jgi:Cof subfamily protein (haloacid dehalogenase superfamily)